MPDIQSMNAESFAILNCIISLSCFANKDRVRHNCFMVEAKYFITKSVKLDRVNVISQFLLSYSHKTLLAK